MGNVYNNWNYTHYSLKNRLFMKSAKAINLTNLVEIGNETPINPVLNSSKKH